MFTRLRFAFIYLLAVLFASTSFGKEFEPTVAIALLVRNKAHALPYVLGALERQDYPMDRVSLWIREDNSVDDSARLLESWRSAHLSKPQSLFFSIDLKTSKKIESVDIDDYVIPEWTDERYSNVMRLREKALNEARRSQSDRLFLLDADVVLTNTNALRYLVQMSESVAVLAPLLNCTGGRSSGSASSYANFWGAIDDKTGYYKRSDDYFSIKGRVKIGLFEVPMVHTALMINLRHVDSAKVKFEKPELKEKYSGPFDDIIVFALRSQQNGLKFFLDNRIFFGYFTEPLSGFYLNNEHEYFRHLLMEAMLEQVDVALNSGLSNDTISAPIESLSSSVFLDATWCKPPAVRRYGFDRIYFINLARRVDRRRKMEFSFKLLGIDAEYFEAVDGKSLNVSYLSGLRVRQMPGYSDPYYRRGLKLGEVGCFLSHMRIWQELANDPDLTKVIIFEDDIRFHAMFDSIFTAALDEIEKLRPDWELLYLGRKILLSNETMLPTARYLALPGYTYWTLSYAITKRGAQKLLAQEPLTRMIAVDEFLPIMFDKHPQADWKSYFEPRDLIALTLAPLIVEPTHYVGAKHYFSDTEASVVLCNDSDGAVNTVDSTLELCGKHKLNLSERTFQADSPTSSSATSSKQEL